MFKDGDALSEAQKSEGLNRCWVLLKINEQKTISDVVSHLLNTFQLQHSCPHGLLLSIGGFVLPAFERTCILKDKDIIRVKKRENTLVVKGTNISALAEKSKALEKQPVNSGVLLLANEEFEKEKGGYKSEEPEEEDREPFKDLEGTSGVQDVSKKRKRKAAEECQDSKTKKKKKKQRSEAPDNVTCDVHTEQIRSHQDDVRMEKKGLSMKENTDFKYDENVENNEDTMRSQKHKENGQEIEGAALAPQEPKKISRNSKRAYARRKWKKEMMKIQKENEACELEGLQNRKKGRGKAKRNEVECQSKGQRSWRKDRAKTERNEVDGQPKGLLHWKQLSGSNTTKTSEKCQQQTQTIDLHEHPHPNGEVHEEPIQNGEVLEQPNQNGNTSEWSTELVEEAEVVPIVVRPGHIRFEPLEKEHAVEQNQLPMDTLQWNGITSKKKGQKWGREKHAFTPRNGHKDSNEDFSEILSDAKKNLSDEGIDFDKLPALVDMPMEGDVIAYRILELSSSWTPELSSYRVGKVSWVNTESRQTMLMPVPEYPVVSKKLDEDESAAQPDNPLYHEDGSLEIDLSSLVDIRIVKGGNTGPRKTTPSCDNEGPVGNENTGALELPSGKDKQSCAPASDRAELNSGKQTQPPTIDNGVNAWDEISATLNAKKAQLLQENSCGKESSGKKSWSYKALRGSALGPTMAILRSEKEI